MLALVPPTLLPTLLLPTGPAVRRAPAARMAGISVDFPDLDGSSVRVGIIKARWHEKIGDALIKDAKKAMLKCGVDAENIVETEVPGSFELPLAARYLALSGTVDVILPVGVLIKGDTAHFDIIAESVTQGLMNVGLQTGVPTIMGILTVNDEKQAVERSKGPLGHGTQWGNAAVEMALLRATAVGGAGRKFFMGFGDPDEKDAPGKPKKVGSKQVGF